MSQQGMDRFLRALRQDPQLSQHFNTVVAKLAHDSGFDVTYGDVRAFTDDVTQRPAPRPVSPGHPSVTLAIGEEDKTVPNQNMTEAVGEEDWTPETPATTAAVGEEDRPKNPGGPRPQPPRPPGGVTTMAVGEEDKYRDRTPAPRPRFPDVTSMAVGEEDLPPRRNATTMAVGEEGGPQIHPTKPGITPPTGNPADAPKGDNPKPKTKERPKGPAA